MQREQRTFWAAVATLALFSITGCGGPVGAGSAHPGDVIGQVSDDSNHYDNDDRADLAIKLDGGTCKKETPPPPPPSPHTPCCCPRPTRVLCRDVSKLKENDR